MKVFLHCVITVMLAGFLTCPSKFINVLTLYCLLPITPIPTTHSHSPVLSSTSGSDKEQ